jgi:hypothetical protein
MASRKHIEGCIPLVHGIDMDAQGDHSRQKLGRRLDMKLPALDRPRAKTIDLDPLGNADRPVLMPAEAPVRLR